MQVLVLDDHIERQRAISNALLAKGFFVLRAETPEEAHAYMRRTILDVVILRHWIGRRATLSVALAAEYYNQQVATLLLSDMGGADADELFELIPSMTSMLGEATPPGLVARLAMAAVDKPPREALLLANEDRVWPEDGAPGAPELPVFVSRRSAASFTRMSA